MAWLALSSWHAQAEDSPSYTAALRAWETGRPLEAEQLLRQTMGEQPEHAGAWLDLAILHCSQGRKTEAEQLFQGIERQFAPPPEILSVIRQQRDSGCTAPPPPAHLRLRAGRGTDSNVNQGANSPSLTIGNASQPIELRLAPEYLPRRDNFSLLQGTYLRQAITPNGLAAVQFFIRKNDTLGSFDQASALGAFEQPWTTSILQGRAAASFSLLQLGGTLYYRQLQLQLQAGPQTKFFDRWQFAALGEWSLVDYPTLTGYSGQVWRGGVSASSKTAAGSLRIATGYTQDLSNKPELRPGGNRSGLFASLHAGWELSKKLTLDLSYLFQQWESERIYSPGLFDRRRVQNTHSLSVAAAYEVVPQQFLTLELRSIENQDSISVFAYRSQIFQLSWEWRY